METIRQAFDTLLSWLLLPPTLYGAGGAMLRASRTGRKWKQIVLETIGGVIVANMVGPLLSVHAPEHWHGTLYFLAGWGGLELVAWGYEQAVRIAEARLHHRLGSEQGQEQAQHPWDGVDRRKPASNDLTTHSQTNTPPHN